nr:unnamed protein product [Digitaria exilis]
MALQDTTSRRGIRANTWRAEGRSRHLAYPSRSAFHETRLGRGISSNTRRAWSGSAQAAYAWTRELATWRSAGRSPRRSGAAAMEAEDRRAAARARKGKVRWDGRRAERRRRMKREKEREGDGEREVERMRGSRSPVVSVRPLRWRRRCGSSGGEEGGGGMSRR